MVNNQRYCVLTNEYTDVLIAVVSDEYVVRVPNAMVGLLNLGNTCYMNAFLQILYMTNDMKEVILSQPAAALQQVCLILLWYSILRR